MFAPRPISRMDAPAVIFAFLLVAVVLLWCWSRTGEGPGSWKVGVPSAGTWVLAGGAAASVTSVPTGAAFRVGSSRNSNPVAEYLENAELRCEGDGQRQNLLAALDDIIHLPPDELEKRRYRDSEGRAGRWDLPTLLARHLVPDRQGEGLGERFYADVKARSVRRQVKALIEELGGRP